MPSFSPCSRYTHTHYYILLFRSRQPASHPRQLHSASRIASTAGGGIRLASPCFVPFPSLLVFLYLTHAVHKASRKTTLLCRYISPYQFFFFSSQQQHQSFRLRLLACTLPSQLRVIGRTDNFISLLFFSARVSRS